MRVYLDKSLLYVSALISKQQTEKDPMGRLQNNPTTLDKSSETDQDFSVSLGGTPSHHIIEYI